MEVAKPGPAIRLAGVLSFLLGLASAAMSQASPPVAATRKSPSDGAEMVRVPAGEFRMGSDAAEIDRDFRRLQWPGGDFRAMASDESPAHRVKISRSFWMYRTAVTNSMYREFVRSTHHRAPGFVGRGRQGFQLTWEDPRLNAPNQPVVGVSWDDAVAYCRWASGGLAPGDVIRLPTEAEWEYAARGTATGLNGKPHHTFVWGDEPPSTRERPANVADERAKSAKREPKPEVFFSGYDDGTTYTSSVGQYPANDYGLFDMAGNVWQWCLDAFRLGYYTGRPDLDVDPCGSASSRYRVARGGSWMEDVRQLRVSSRFRPFGGMRDDSTGFRCVCVHGGPLEEAFEAPTLSPDEPVQNLLYEIGRLVDTGNTGPALEACNRGLSIADVSHDVPGAIAVLRQRALALEQKGGWEALSSWNSVEGACKSVGDVPGQIDALTHIAALPIAISYRQPVVARIVALGRAERVRLRAVAVALLAASLRFRQIHWKAGAEATEAELRRIELAVPPDSPKYAELLGALALVAANRDETVLAGTYCMRALQAWESHPWPSLDLPATAYRVAYIIRHEGNSAVARALGDRCARSQERLAPRSWDLATTLTLLASTATAQYDTFAAKRYARKSLDLWEKLAPDSSEFSAALGELGNAELRSGNAEAALSAYRSALAIREVTLPDTRYHADTLMNVGLALRRLGELEQAEVVQQKTVAIFRRKSEEPADLVRALNNLGNCLREEGRLKEARQSYDEAYRTGYRLCPDRDPTAEALSGLGNVAADQGDLLAAQQYYYRSARLRQKMRPPSQYLDVSLNNLGDVDADLGNPAAAAKLIQRAYDLSRDPFSKAIAQSNLATLAFDRGNFKAAWDLQQKALHAFQKVARESLETANCYQNLGQIAEEQHDNRNARLNYEHALALRSRLAPGSLDEATSLAAVGRQLRLARDLHGAERCLNAAWTILRSQSQEVSGDEALLAFGSQSRHLAAELSAIQIALGRREAALSTIEEGRSRAFERQVGERSITAELAPENWPAYWEAVSRQRHAREEQERAAAMVEREIERLSRADQKQGRSTIRQALNEARRVFSVRTAAYTRYRADAADQWAKVREEVLRRSPGAVPASLSPEAAIAAIPRGTVVLEFAVGERESRIFVARRSSRVEDYLIKHSEKELVNQINRVRKITLSPFEAQYLGREKCLQSFRDAWVFLLPQQVRAAIAAADRIVLCPDGPYWDLPFAALVTDGKNGKRFLGLEKDLVMAQSLTSFVNGIQAPLPPTTDLTRAVIVGIDHVIPATVNEHKDADDPILDGPTLGNGDARRRQTASKQSRPNRAGDNAVGEQRLLTRDGTMSDLKHAESEANRVAPFYGATPSLGANATEAWFRENAPNAPMIHLATHGFFRSQLPMSSGVLLAPAPRAAGVLQAWKVLQLRLRADLVVLSACVSALGRREPGQGLIGLTRAWQIAGARSVVASNWVVDDRVSEDLMAAFHGQLKAGRAKDEALRRAMRETANDHWEPFYWAPFVLVGDPENHLFPKH